MTKVVEVEIDREIAVLSGKEDVYLKVDSFIRERIPALDIFMEFDLDDEKEEPPTNEKLCKEFFNMFYAAVKTQDMDLFASVLSGDSIQEVWEGEILIEKRIEKMDNFLDTVSRAGKLSSIHYQFKMDKNDLQTDNGTLYMIYEDGVEVPIPFELVLIGDIEDEERYYQFSNTIKEIKQQLHQYN